MSNIEVEYRIMGSGAAGMAFADSLLTHSEASAQSSGWRR